jgi:hypothetical protein
MSANGLDPVFQYRQFVEQERARLQAQAAVLQTDKAAYLQALKSSLPAVGGSDTIKLS